MAHSPSSNQNLKIEPDAARAVLLMVMPRRLRVCLVSGLKITAARVVLAKDIAVLIPEASTLAQTWVEAAAAADIFVWNDDPFVAARSALTFYLDRHAIQADCPAAGVLSDTVTLLSCAGDNQAAAVRLALPLQVDLAELPDLDVRLSDLATAQANLSLGPFEANDDEFDPEAAARYARTHKELSEAWRFALEEALIALRGDAFAVVAAASIVATGAVDDFFDGMVQAQAFHAFGQRLSWPVTEAARLVEREKRKRVEALLAETDARLRKQTVALSSAGANRQATSEVPIAVPEGHVLAVPRIQETGSDKGRSAAKGYESIIGKALPLAPAPDIAKVRAALLFEFPYAQNTIDRLLTDLVGRRYAVLRPTVLVGAPGAGKSRFVSRLAHHLGVGLWRVDGTRDSGACIGGLDRRWASSEPCHPIMAMNRSQIANPIMMIDEIEKAATRTDYGRLWDALLPMLEPETAKAYQDPAFQVEVDLRFISWIATANRLDSLPGPLRDRLRVLKMPEPGSEHLDALLPAVLKEIASAHGIDHRFLPSLSSTDLAALHDAWKGGSVRRLIRVVEALLATHEVQQSRH